MTHRCFTNGKKKSTNISAFIIIHTYIWEVQDRNKTYVWLGTISGRCRFYIFQIILCSCSLILAGCTIYNSAYPFNHPKNANPSDLHYMKNLMLVSCFLIYFTRTLSHIRPAKGNSLQWNLKRALPLENHHSAFFAPSTSEGAFFTDSTLIWC